MPESPSLSIKDRFFQALRKKPQLLTRAAIMAGARVVGMGFGVFGSVWAARCLGPLNFGISGMVQSLVVQTLLLVNVIYPTVLIREYKNAPDNGARAHLVRITNGFRLATALSFCALAAAVMGLHLAPEGFHFAGWFFLPILFLNALQPTWIFQASEKQHFQSALAVFQPALTAALYFFWFKPGMSAGADLVVISLVSAVLTVIYWKAVFKLTSFKGSFFLWDKWEDVLALVQKSRWLFLSALAISVYTTLDQPLLGWLYSLEELGKYRTAVRVTDAAQNLLTILPAILFPRFIEWRKRGEEFFWNRQLKLLALGLAGCGAAILLGFILIPLFYPVVFGAVYARAAWPCVILLSSKFMEALNQIFSLGLMTDHTYDRFVFFSTVFIAVFSLGSNLLFIPRFGMYATAEVNLLSETLMLAICFWLAFRRIRKIRG